ncbi:hypothetical protein [Antrihabitans spumae]|uniref:Phage shock protein B n=1 Tax=Antrihabitans spumae TaxID=3373370 RepID=A0ABW7K6X9_9NOCA
MSWVGDVLEFALLWLAMYAVIFVAYLAIILFVIDPLSTWQERRRTRRQLIDATERELGRIERQGADSVQRIESAFIAAQQIVRDEATRRDS